MLLKHLVRQSLETVFRPELLSLQIYVITAQQMQLAPEQE